MPDCILLRVERFLVIDHAENTLYAAASGDDAEAMARRHRIAVSPRSMSQASVRIRRNQTGRALPHLTRRVSRPHPRMSLVHRRRRELRNLPDQQSSARIRQSPPWIITKHFAERIPRPTAAYLKLADIEVASSSPECFLRIDRDRRAESRPIKGTVRRGRDAEEDAKLRDLLGQRSALSGRKSDDCRSGAATISRVYACRAAFRCPR